MDNDPRDIWLWQGMWTKAVTNRGMSQNDLASRLAKAYNAWTAWRDIDGSWYFHLPDGKVIH